MESIQALINRLQQQLKQHADAGQMMNTLLLMKKELSKQLPASGKVLGTSKVAVLLPVAYSIHQADTEKNTSSSAPPFSETKTVPEVNPETEQPAVASAQAVKEVNESVKQSESLNDKLKAGQTEIMQVITDAPIRDLRKAIGINDQFVFINELFHGDEALYERSLKTLNSFSAFPEAEFWLNRELRSKLGWKENQETVKHFYQLVKRRFS
jgi:hypothetical protein